MYYDKIVTEKVYYITGGQVKHANPQFNTLKNDYELSLDRNTVIEAAPEDDSVAWSLCVSSPLPNTGT